VLGASGDVALRKPGLKGDIWATGPPAFDPLSFGQVLEMISFSRDLAKSSCRFLSSPCFPMLPL